MQYYKKWLTVVLVVLGLICLLTLSIGAEETMPPDVPQTEETYPWAGTLLNLVETYAGELLALFTLVVSLFNTYRYQKGLVPMLYGGVQAVSKATETASREAGVSIQETRNRLEDFIQEVQPLLIRMEKTLEGIVDLEQQAKTLEERIAEGECDRALVKQWMDGVAELLYRVFSSANLPAYAKDAMGNCYTALKGLSEAIQEEAPHEVE